MGCLFEIIFEVFFEGVFEGIMWCYMKLMQLIIPQKNISDKTKKIIKNVITIASPTLFLILFIGAVCWFQDAELTVKHIGKYMTLIPLTIITLQISLGIISKIVLLFRK